MFTSNEQISPPSLVLNCKVAKFCIKECPKAVNLKRISTQKECKCKEFSLQTRLGGEICSSDVIMHKGHYERCIKNVDEFRRGQLDGEEEENSKTFLFPVEKVQTVFNGNRTRLNIFIIITLLILFDLILLARSLR